MQRICRWATKTSGWQFFQLRRSAIFPPLLPPYPLLEQKFQGSYPGSVGVYAAGLHYPGAPKGQEGGGGSSGWRSWGTRGFRHPGVLPCKLHGVPVGIC